MSPRRSLRARAALINASSSAPSNAMSSPRRTTGGIPSSPSVTVSRSAPNSPEESPKSIRLTVKMPASKLREVITGEAKQRPHNIFAEPEIMSGPRNSRNKRRIVEVDTDEEDDMDEEEDGNEYEEGAADQEASDQDDNADADGDVDMDDESPVPVSKRQAAAKPALTVTSAAESRVRNVDAKDMELDDDDDDDDDEELSELESDAEGEDDNDIIAAEEATRAEGRAEEQELEEGDEEEEDESDGELGTPATGSRASTPNGGKMTKRQRGRVELGGDFLQLPMGKYFIQKTATFCNILLYVSFPCLTTFFTVYRATSQEALDSGRTCYAPGRNGTKEEELE